MSVGSTILSIENLSQSVAALLGDPAPFTSAYQTTIANIQADVTGLSLTATQRTEINTVLGQASGIISGATVGAITIQQLNTILDLLQLAVLKLNTFAFLG